MARSAFILVLQLIACSPTAASSVHREPAQPVIPVQAKANALPVPSASAEPIPAPIATAPSRPEPLPTPLPARPSPLVAALEQWNAPVEHGADPVEVLARTWAALQTGLPALSESTREIWLDISHYPCCASNGSSLLEARKLQDPESGKGEATVWQLFRYDENGTPIYPASVSRTAMQSALKRLARSRPRALAVLVEPAGDQPMLDVRWSHYGLWLTEQKPTRLELREDDSVVSVATIPTFRKAGYCCGLDDAKATCTVPGYIEGVWVDEPTRLLVLVVGNNGGPDGCESHPMTLSIEWPKVYR